MRLRHTRCAREKGGELFECEGEQYFTHTENCNSWDQQTCPSPCEGYECMDFGACVDVSTAEDPIAVSAAAVTSSKDLLFCRVLENI